MESLFLQQARKAYNSNNRTHYPLYGQSVTNLDAVNFYLGQACHLTSPTLRTDILITLANMATFQGNLPTALGLYQQALVHANTQQQEDILCYQTMWYAITGLDKLAAETQCSLQARTPHRAQSLSNVIDTVNTLLTTPMALSAKALPAMPGETMTLHAFVILGHKLNPDGSLSDLLQARLEALLMLKQQTPTSRIIVTGGVQQAGMTEAECMQQWLVKHGVDTRHILMDTLAANTLENTSNSLAIAASHGITHLTLVTHANHVHRALTLFNSMQQSAATIAINATSVEYIEKIKRAACTKHAVTDGNTTTLPPPNGQQRINCVIDALRGFGLPAFRVGQYVEI
ncbi:YdcF family protein [Photobacterium aphoticum]|uniref:DUF218 domain-containing protein n=1 Tax=Photobacterium aphoticum TaxID=754436 RepID=A0A0J1GPI0_9GAMM|nr:YdcF family protein [Photobacterium aphoticum]KLV01673.1 hypothetical protein ABT58_04240 [Photobacterium aphoticum]PSU59246.1 YdcF family protein [Photobacterium aphoticum]GHA31306.1 transporter [Photobacterium aphoticum]